MTEQGSKNVLKALAGPAFFNLIWLFFTYTSQCLNQLLLRLCAISHEGKWEKR